MAAWRFSPSGPRKDADLLLGRVTSASRNPALFGVGRTPDTLQGRFELVTLHAVLAMTRLQQSPDAAPLAQAFVDALFKQLDSGLREDGVADLSVPKRMHKLAAAFYGRLNAYAAPLAAADAAALRAAFERNIVGAEHPFLEALARHSCDVASGQAAKPWAALLTAEAWPAFVA